MSKISRACLRSGKLSQTSAMQVAYPREGKKDRRLASCRPHQFSEPNHRRHNQREECLGRSSVELLSNHQRMLAHWRIHSNPKRPRTKHKISRSFWVSKQIVQTKWWTILSSKRQQLQRAAALCNRSHPHLAIHSLPKLTSLRKRMKPRQRQLQHQQLLQKRS